jgi:hypothetical protein
MLSKLLALAVSNQGANYWIATLSQSSRDVIGKDIAVDSTGVYLVGDIVYDSEIAYTHAFAAKYTFQGALVQQVRAGSATDGYFATSSAVTLRPDNEDGVKAVTCGKLVEAGVDYGFLLGYGENLPSNSSLPYVSFDGIECSDVAFGSDGQHYLSGHGDSTPLLWIKYLTSPTARQIATASVNTVSRSVALDSSNNAYIAGSRSWTPFGGSAIPRGYIAKFNNSGTLQWQRDAGFITTNVPWFSTIYDVTVSTSGSLYAITNRIMKVDASTGNLTWARTLGSATFQAATTDDDDNLYIAGSNYIAKYDSSGTIQWQRQMVGATDFVGIAHYLNAVYVIGTTGSSAFIAKLPDDGSLTGTYGSFTYQASSLSAATSSTSFSSVSLTASSLSLSETPAPDLSASTMTSSTVVL